MHSIDIKRFGQAMLWSIVSEKKKLVNNFIGNFIFYVLAMTISLGIFSGYRNGINIIQVTTAAALCIGAWIIIGGWYTAELFSNLRTKQGRVQFFMLPTTNKERYWSRVLLALGKGLILSTVALIAADLIQMLISFCFCGDAMSVSKNILQGITDIDGIKSFIAVVSDNGSTIDAFFTVVSAIWLVTVYILGGTLLRKAPAVLTTLILFFGGVALSLACAGIAWLIFGNAEYEVEFWWDPETTIEWVVTIILIAFSVFNMWFSYRTFRRMQII